MDVLAGQKPNKPEKPIPPKISAPMPPKFNFLKPGGAATKESGVGIGKSLPTTPQTPISRATLLKRDPLGKAPPGAMPAGLAQGLFAAKSAGVASKSGGPQLALGKTRAGVGIRKSTVGAGSYSSGISSFSTYFLEKQAIVLDFGHALTKVGFATEGRPRHIIPSPELRQRRQISKALTGTIPESEWVDLLDKFFNKVFFHYLCVSPKDRRVIVCDSVVCSAAFRDALAFVLFKRFSAPAAAYMADLVLPLYLTGLNTGIVIDCGYDCARVMPTLASVPIFSAYSTAQAGGRHVNALLQKQLRASGVACEEWVDNETVIEDLKCQVCFVPCTWGGSRESLTTDLPAVFTPPRGDSVKVPASVRSEPCEVFFAAGAGKAGSEANDSVNGEPGMVHTIPEAIVESLLSLAIDARQQVVQNIVICGGSSLLPGFLPRLALEIQEEIRSRPNLESLVKWLRFTPVDFSPITAVWVGGAIYGALEGVVEYTSEDYERGRPLPDWASDGYV
eukprot:TRINITY_DN60732_c0_g1_i1.p1 TRINITY_DN60732_c0_g1~~TRINITY_DN60732_c0_g1_i1.p1  ORF type:complete len:505 (+),score=93.66 TRINITY_DN60732_c0_g1_i1:83-1597(+)